MESKEQIKAALKELSPLLAGMDKTMPQLLPADYFTSFPAKMLQLAKVSSLSVSSELASIAPLLNQISKKSPQSIPEGYFNEWRAQPNHQPAKIIQMPLVRKWMSYAAAAIVAGVLITAGFIFNDKPSTSFDFDYYSKIDVPTALNQVPEEELQNYLSTAASLSGNEQESISEELENNNQGNFQQISDDELNTYLKEIGGNIPNQKES